MALTNEELDAQLAQATENSMRDRRMAYPNLLEILGATTIAELQAQRIAEFNRQVEKNKRHIENKLAEEGTFGARNVDDELLCTTTGTLRGQTNIAVEGRRPTEAALR